MPVAQVSDLVEALFSFASSAPDAALISAYRRAARKFFTDTRAWRDELAVDQGATTAYYTIDAPVDSECFDFSYIQYADTFLTKLTLEQSMARRIDRTSVDPRNARIGDVNTIIVSPDPQRDISESVTVRGILRPTLTADTIPDALVNRFTECIEYGALYNVFRAREEWGDMEQSAYYRALFQDSIDMHSVMGSDGNMRGVKRVVRYGGL